MLDIELEGRAGAFAIAAHEAIGQKRKYTNEHYWGHCWNVVELVSNNGHDSVVVAAAWLHDVLEDTKVSFDTILDHFGAEVANIVYELTDREEGNRKTRKELARQRLANASAEAQTIKLADLIDNTQSIIEHDPEFAKVYMAEKKALLEVLTKGDKRLYDEAKAIIDEYYA